MNIEKFLKDKDINVRNQLDERDKRILKNLLDGEQKTIYQISKELKENNGTIKSHVHRLCFELKLLDYTDQTIMKTIRYYYIKNYEVK